MTADRLFFLQDMIERIQKGEISDTTKLSYEYTARLDAALSIAKEALVRLTNADCISDSMVAESALNKLKNLGF